MYFLFKNQLSINNNCFIMSDLTRAITATPPIVESTENLNSIDIDLDLTWNHSKGYHYNKSKGINEPDLESDLDLDRKNSAQKQFDDNLENNSGTQIPVTESSRSNYSALSTSQQQNFKMDPEPDYNQSLGHTRRRIENEPDYHGFSTTSTKSNSTTDYSLSSRGDFGSTIDSPGSNSKSTTKPAHFNNNSDGRSSSNDFENIAERGASSERGVQKKTKNAIAIKMKAIKIYAPNTRPEDMKDLSKLPELTLDNITQCLEKRFNQDLIYVSINR